MPDCSTYNVQVRQAIEVEVEIMFGGKKFGIAYQRQKYKWEKWLALNKTDCVPLATGVTKRQHQLKGQIIDGSSGNMEWWLDGNDRDSYIFTELSKQ